MTQTLFNKLGYQVVSENCGVYHLEVPMQSTPIRFAGLLVAIDPPLLASLSKVKLVLFEITSGMPTDRILRHWGNLDARHIGDTGIPEVSVDVTPAMLEGFVQQELPRPDEGHIRSGVRLRTGEFICYN